MLRVYWICCLVVIGCGFLQAQNPVAIRYTVDDGLPSNEVYDAYEDHDGNIWFATDHGISMFDGYAFQNFSQADGLACNTIFGFAEDPTGLVWMRGLDGTLSILDHGRVRPYPFNDRLREQLHGTFINTMTCPEVGKMYLTLAPAAPQTFLLDLYTGRLDTVRFPDSTNAGLIRLPASGKTVFVAAPSIFGQDDSPDADLGQRCEGERISWQLHYDLKRRFHMSRVMGVTLGPDHWVAAMAHQLFEIRGCKVSAPLALPNGFNALELDHDGKVWIATSQGLQCLGADLRPEATLFHDETVFEVLHDSNRSYWICTINGVLLVRNLSNRVYAKVHGEPLLNVNRMRRVDSTLYMLCGHDSILAANLNESGWFWLDKRFVLMSGEGNHDFMPLPEYGQLLAGRRSFDMATGKVTHTPKWPESGFPARSMFRRGNLLYMAASYGYVIWDLVAGKLVNPNNRSRRLRFHTAMFPDSKGRIWLGSTEGLYLYDPDTLIPFHPENPIFRNRVTDIAELGNGMIVVATRGAGIYGIWGDQVWNLRERQGLVSDMCNRLYEGPSGLWVCTNRGLSLVRRSANGLKGHSHVSILNYNMLDGLPSNKVNDIFEYEGKAYIATDVGIVALEVEDRGRSRLPQSTKITQLLAEGEVVAPGQALDTDQDNLEFRFQGRLLPALGDVRYRYRLQGYDRDWRMSEGRSAYYYNLPPGSYTFEVSAIYPSAAPNANLARMEVDLPPKLHERWWFRVLAGLAVLLFVGVLTWLGMRSKQRRTETNLQLLQAEIKALRSQMRPHFIFNVLNSIQHLLKLRDHETAERHLVGFSKLMRAVLEASNHETIPISREVEILWDYLDLEKLRFGPEFTYHVELQPGVNWDACQVPPMLLQPLLENAIWHGLQMQRDRPTLWLRIGRSLDGTICIEVEDNGIGREAASQIARKHLGPSLALTNIHERIRLINVTHSTHISLYIDDLLDASGHPRGTLVRLYLPTSSYVSRNR
ncbi:MAG: two-component regulator propeller domain-containing protein [Bacteroidia bacterium]